MPRRQGEHQHVGQWLPKVERLAIYLRDGFACSYCDQDLHGALVSDITLDHVLCQSDGGEDTHANLVTCCRSCNSARQDKTVEDFAGVDAAESVSFALEQPMDAYRELAASFLGHNVRARSGRAGLSRIVDDLW